jgi:hypothetical protein
MATLLLCKDYVWVSLGNAMKALQSEANTLPCLMGVAYEDMCGSLARFHNFAIMIGAESKAKHKAKCVGFTWKRMKAT